MEGKEANIYLNESKWHGPDGYDSVKGSLQIRICDPEQDEDRLQGVISRKQGDFAAVYFVHLSEDGADRTAVTQKMLDEWGISVEQLHKDALTADLLRTPVLNDVDNMLFCIFHGKEPVNFLDADCREVDQSERLPELAEQGFLIYRLTNAESREGSAYLLNESLMRSVGEVVGEDFYVLPSSVHDVMLIPVSSGKELSELQKIVKEENRMDVAEEDILSDKVQYYDKDAAVLENAQARAERLEKERKADHPQSILKRLSETKEQRGKTEKAAFQGERKKTEITI